MNHNIILSGNNSKPILRELAGKLLPKQVVVAPKRGFEIPLVYWVEEKLYEMIHKVELQPSDAFTLLYGILISKEKGPKLAGFMRIIGKEKIASLLGDIL